MVRLIVPIIALLLIIACKSENKKESKTEQNITVRDPHSCAKQDEAVVKHLDLDIIVDFESQIIAGTASWDVEIKKGNTINFDTRDIHIESITLDDGSTAKYSFGKSILFLGQALTVNVKPDTKKVIIKYTTTPDAAALQWLSPDQTFGKELPYLFTQGEAILTRSWIPCQDSPGIRFTYSAKVQVPKSMLAVMSAENPQKKNDNGVYTFKMDNPIPAYLMALSVGDIAFKSVGPRTGVYAEPGMLEKSAWELGEMEKMVSDAEALYGEYKWGRYDVLILPPSFPFGGMENPKLTFATPTIIAGDRSLTALIAHELAHSWSGNLVTNATWNDFWLNEGFTVYFERRIIEKMYGKDFADMEARLGYQDFVEEVKYQGDTSLDTRLHLSLENRDPDEGMSDIAYEKGYAFLRYLEEQTSRDSLDRFLKNYFNHFAFKTITTEQFVKYLKDNYLSKFPKANVDVNEWVYKTGIPKVHRAPVSVKFAAIDEWLENYKNGKFKEADLPKSFSTHEWIYLIRNLPETISEKQFKEWESLYKWSKSGNAEIKAAWFEKAINAGYGKYLLADIERFLVSVGRRKYLEPIYTSMVEHRLVKEANEIYKKARPAYHFVSVQTIDALLKYRES